MIGVAFETAGDALAHESGKAYPLARGRRIELVIRRGAQTHMHAHRGLLRIAPWAAARALGWRHWSVSVAPRLGLVAIPLQRIATDSETSGFKRPQVGGK